MKSTGERIGNVLSAEQKIIGKERTLANYYDESMAKKIATFLEEWDAGIVPYVRS